MVARKSQYSLDYILYVRVIMVFWFAPEPVLHCTVIQPAPLQAHSELVSSGPGIITRLTVIKETEKKRGRGREREREGEREREREGDR